MGLATRSVHLTGHGDPRSRSGSKGWEGWLGASLVNAVVYMSWELVKRLLFG